MSTPAHPLDFAAEIVRRATALGAGEVSAAVSEGTTISITRRDRKVEEATEASTRRLSLSLLVDDRYSAHSTSDLRPEALDAFLRRAVDATRLLEPDPDHALAPAEECGRGASDAELETLDPRYATFSPEDRAQLVERLEGAFLDRAGPDFVSATVYIGDGHGRYAQVTSHGFSDTTEGASFSLGGTVTLAEPGRRPEGSSGYGTRFLADLPDVDRIADEAFTRARDAIGAGPIASGRYPMILSNRVAARILGLLAEPLGGYALHHGRSCLADHEGKAIGSSLLHLVDDPLIPRGLGSEPWDGDLRVSKPRVIVEGGVLRSYYIDTFHSRRLSRPATTGHKSNWILPVGDRPWRALAADLPEAIYVTGFLGGNANGLTGDFSFGVRGKLLRHGEEVANLAEMNVSGNTLQIFHQLVALADDPWVYSTTRAPTMLFEGVPFSGT